MLVINFIFYLISILIILSSIMVILSKKPMNSVLALIFTFINTSILFLLLRAEFIAMVMLVVYVGAILVLFLFVIMLLNIKEAEKRKIMTKVFLAGLVISILVFIEIAIILHANILTMPTLNNLNLKLDVNNSYNIGELLYNNYGIIVLLLGVLLTIIAIGVIYINYQDIEVKKQKMFNQVRRNGNDTVKATKVDIEEGIK